MGVPKLVYTSSDVTTEQFTSSVRASLAEPHLNAVIEAANSVPGEWQVDWQEDYEGYVTILVTAREADVTWPTFVVSGHVQGIELDKLHGDDDLANCGCFETIKAAASELAVEMTKEFQLRGTVRAGSRAAEGGGQVICSELQSSASGIALI